MRRCSFLRVCNLADAVAELGGALATMGNPLFSVVQIGTVPANMDNTAWQLTWQGWRGGVVLSHVARRLPDRRRGQ
jgi:hypothetical protein